MTKFYETCNRCDAEVICDCPYCEALLEALKAVQKEYEKMHLETLVKSLIDAAIKEADNG